MKKNSAFFMWIPFIFYLLTGAAHAADVKAIIEAGDLLYSEREDLSKAYAAVEKYKEALSLDPGYYEAMWKISKTAFYLAEFLKKGKEKENIVETGVNYAKKAVAANPKGVDGHFWLGVSYTKVGEVKGVLKSLFLISPIKKEMRKVIELDETYEGAGAFVVLGRVYSQVPGILGGSNSKARFYLEKAMNMFPKNSMGLLFLAEVYWDIDEKKLAISTLEKILQMEPDNRWIPETKQKKIDAAVLLKKYK
jgi:tetratricopeptide (TPR) repeat protein